MKKLILLILCAVLFKEGMAQVKFTGRVMDENGVKPLVGATVTLTKESFNKMLVTDEYGRFLFDVEPAVYQLNIFYLGYETITESVDLNSSTSKEYLMKFSAERLQGATISALRASKADPITATTLSKKELELLDQSKDLPYLLRGTPSVVISTDAGNGVGYTGIRIRGIDPTRVNVTVNDVPLNDAESQGVYWVNLPDLASSTGSIQIQRGIGTSTNGAAAFGASVNVQTDAIEDKKFAKAHLALGAFNTQRVSIMAGSGKMKNGFAVQGRASYIRSDGFIDRASSDLRSMQLTAAKFGKKSVLKANVMIGRERTYQAWWGIPQPKYQEDESELNRYVNQLWIGGEDLYNLENSDPQTYNYYTYENQVDDYHQDHYQLFYTLFLNKASHVKFTGHYTRGKGYFEEMNRSDAFDNYGLAPEVIGTDTFYTADIVRRRWLDNHFYGGIASYQLVKKKYKLNAGISANQYLGRHFGQVVDTEFTDYEGMDHVYYDEDAVKNDANIYSRVNFNLNRFRPYIDLQYRWIDYSFQGPDGNGETVEQKVNYGFFNPKVGATYRLSYNLRFRALYAIANREPVRQDLVASTPANRPQAEQMNDVELGVEILSSRININITAYDMQYTNALVLNGQVNDVGLYTRVNVDESYRRGLELAADVLMSRHLSIGGNITFAENKIPNYTEYVDNWEPPYDQKVFSYENTDIAFSPNTIAAASMMIKPIRNFSIEVLGKYVDEQYLDNTMSDERKLDAFSTLNIAFNFKKSLKKERKLNFGVYLNNINNERYAPNGYTFSGVIGGQRESFNYVYPAAGFNWMTKISIDL